jgi:hypothetical protein
LHFKGGAFGLAEKEKERIRPFFKKPYLGVVG